MALTALEGLHDTGLIKILGIRGTDTDGRIGFVCDYNGADSIVHVHEIAENDKAQFALSGTRWLMEGGLDGRSDHKAGVVRDLDLLLDSILGKGNGPRLADLICVQAPNDRTPLFPRFSLLHLAPLVVCENHALLAFIRSEALPRRGTARTQQER